MLENLTTSQVIRDINTRENAEIFRSSDLRPKIVATYDINLGVARTAEDPFIISQPFNGVWCSLATDTNNFVSLGLGGIDKYVTDNAFPITRNSAFYSKNEIKQAVLTWSAQFVSGTAANIRLHFFVGVDYRPGSIISQISGSIAVNAGNFVATGTMALAGNAASVTVTSATAIALFPPNTDRSSFTLYTDQPIWVGDSNVAVGRGIPIAGGQTWKFSNTASLFAIAAGANATVTGVEEEN